MSVPAKFTGFAMSQNKDTYKQSRLVEYEHKNVNPTDVVVKNIACGICGSDVHTVTQAWGPTTRDDLVVGHEIIGHVVAVGADVSEFKVGQRVGIGACSSSCGTCARCVGGNEQYCSKRVGTYNSVDVHSENYKTQGGYASHSIANEMFVFPIPEDLPSNIAAPLLCAGLTTYSPLVRGLGKDAKGKTVGVIGIGGLGHLAIQFAAALGAEVVAFSRSNAKKEEALKMGATSFIATGEEKTWPSTNADRFDFILNCGSGVDGMDLNEYLSVLKVDAKFVSVGLPPVGNSFSVSPFSFLGQGSSFGATCLGSKKEAIEMLALAAEGKVKPWIQEYPIGSEGIAKAFESLEDGTARYRCVLTDFDKVFN